MLVALLPTSKMFLSVEINLEVVEAVVRSCSLKKVLSKILKNSQEFPLLKSLFWKIRLKEKKRNSSTGAFP